METFEELHTWIEEQTEISNKMFMSALPDVNKGSNKVLKYRRYDSIAKYTLRNIIDGDIPFSVA